MQLDYKIHNLFLQVPFQIAKGTYNQRKCLIVILNEKEYTGYGEMTVIDYYNVDLNATIALLESLRQKIESIHLSQPAQLFHTLKDHLSANRFLLSALDCAAYDLYGKLHHKSITQILDISSIRRFPCSYTLSIQTKESIQQTLLELHWPILKCKMGGTDDVAVLDYLYAHGIDAIRIDANEGWDFQFLNKLLRQYSNQFIEFIEQPVKKEQEQLLQHVKGEITIIADESFQTIDSLPLVSKLYDGINIKLMKCGGITAALEIIQQARSMNLKIMLGCMTESSIGISAAAALGSLGDYIDLDGAMLVNDIAYGVEYENGQIIRNEGPGLACGLLSN